MNNQFWTNFFRKDLNLGGRWWHRLFLIFFFIALAWAFYSMSSDLFSGNHPYIPQWKVTDTLNERITVEVRQIRDLKESGEKVEERGSFYAFNSGGDGDSRYADFYCSSELENKITEVQSKSGISTLYIRDIYDRNNVSIETYAKYIRENEVICLVPDAYTVSGDKKIRFLEPLGQSSLYGKDLVFYKKSNFLTVYYVLKMFIIVIAVFVGIAIAYYKILFYVIFGKIK